MSKLVGFLYLLAGVAALVILLTIEGCTSLHDPTWDIEPRPIKDKEVTHIKGHLRPEEKRADQLAPKEISELKVNYPEAFLPALPAIDEQVDPSPVKVAPKYGWSVYRHQAGQPELLQFPLIILDIDPEIPAPDGPST